jgi:hypothetical protein
MTTFRLLIFLLILTIFYGCEGIVEGTGKVVSSVDNKPLENVLVIWTNTDDSCRTDSLGNFTIGSFVGCIPECPQLRLLFHKPGYKNQYLNLSEKKDFLRVKDVLIKMQPTDKKQTTEFPFLSNLFFYMNFAISFLNIVTLIYLLTIKLKYKFLWALLIIFGSVSLHYNFYTNRFDIETFNFLIQFSLINLTGLVKTYLLIPLGSGIFWICRRKKNIA